jgi:hypothetical protein
MLGHDNFRFDGLGEFAPDGQGELQPDGRADGFLDDASYLRVQLDRRAEVSLSLVGAIDQVSNGSFQVAVKDALADRPDHLTFDALSCDFISIQGFALIGKCSLTIEKVTLSTQTDLAQRVLRILGFDDVECVVTAARRDSKVATDQSLT